MPRLTLAEAAKIAGVSQRRLNQLCSEGRIPSARRYGKAWTIIVGDGGGITITPKTTPNGPELTIEPRTSKN